ncbi:hypothetical protein [Enterococcus mediterraneensis]|uniref:hypothetical protein n=1 Tax=Enterococcus mediterraneensis TaxID=2364791 RepID=UPI000F0554E9|nr:hypothetical protein [Enterococcus mediterraneensis]
MNEEIAFKISEEIREAVNEGIKLYQKREELPFYMTKTQAQEYLNVGYLTLMNKYIKNGLKVIMVDGMLRISKDDCDEFMRSHRV